jgi:GTP pyrophosphokinase
MEYKNFEYKSQKENFIFPSLKDEKGEIERISELYAPENESVFMSKFLEAYKKSSLVGLTDNVWGKLENTDSFDIPLGNFNKIEEHISYTNQETDATRDWQDIKQKMEQGKELDAPMILKYDDSFHLISGNTRLMVARALGKTPKVLIIEIKSEQLPKENRETFFKRLEGKLSKEEIQDIDFAYDISKEAHRTAVRDEGMRYFEHPRAGCLIMTDELGLYDRDLLISFLLHDVGEDTPMFGNITKSYDEFRKKAEFRLQKLFGEKVADTVIRLTKPSIDNVKFHSKEEVYDFYLEELKKSEDAILGKMVDRLHNLRTLTTNKPDKIKRQVEETESKYIPIFDSVSGERKQYVEILLSKIKDQLTILKG